MANTETYEEHKRRVDYIKMSEPRKCRFFLRGRCHNKNCEFSHILPSNTISSTTADRYKNQQSGSTSNSLKNATPCRFYKVSIDFKYKAL